MIFSNDEKLTLFLIWWHCEELISLDALSKEFNDNILARGIERDSDFIQFLSEAYEAYEVEEEFEFWVSDYGLSKILDKVDFNFIGKAFKTDSFNRKITITIEN